MKHPNDYPKRILVAVTGMSPQIVTETLYALAIQKQEPFIPTEIHLITTQGGATQARLQLLNSETGKFWQLCADYRLPDIRFQESDIHIIEDQQGNPLDDIKTPEQNEAAADFIANIVSRLCQDDEAALHVSIAGGRKTMGYYLGYALSLYGRAQDRLSHVLVTDKYESLKDFFYPTPDSRVIYYERNNQVQALDAKDAQVMLAEIPFVRLRGGIPQHLLEGKAGFSESIRFARSLEAEPLLRIDQSQRRVFAHDVEIALSDVNYAFYLWMLCRSAEGEPIRRQIEDNQEYAEDFLRVYDRTKPNSGPEMISAKDDDRTKAGLKTGMSAQWLSDRSTAVKKSFETALGKHAAKPYVVQSAGGNNNRQYFLALTDEQIIYS
jgi:CRISPR-associated protein (TIGR02584 family)